MQTFKVQLELLSRGTGSVSKDSLSAFDVIGSKKLEITDDDIVTTGNEESCPRQHRNFNGPKRRHQNSIAPYAADYSNE